jgi:hypothetical protein
MNNRAGVTRAIANPPATKIGRLMQHDSEKAAAESGPSNSLFHVAALLCLLAGFLIRVLTLLSQLLIWTLTLLTNLIWIVVIGISPCSEVEH